MARADQNAVEVSAARGLYTGHCAFRDSAIARWEREKRPTFFGTTPSPTGRRAGDEGRQCAHAIIPGMSVLKKNWIAVTSLACVVVTALYALFAFTAALPPDGGSVIYPFMYAYNYTALPVSIVVLLAALTALFFWIPSALVKRGSWVRDGVLVALACVALIVSIGSALPLGSRIYREVPNGSATANGKTYHLGVIVSGDKAENAYTLCECAGLPCTCRHLFDESLVTLNPLPTLSLAPGTQIVTVQVEDRVLYESQP